jgi:hypothetical protein
MISHLDPEIFAQLTELEELDLYDNKIHTVGEALNHLSNLTYACLHIYDSPRLNRHKGSRPIVQPAESDTRGSPSLEVFANYLFRAESNQEDIWV